MPVPDIEVSVDYALDKTGDIYRAKDPDRWVLPNVFDCSSLGVRAWRAAGIAVPEWVTNTRTIYQWAQQIGALVPVEKAVRTRGAGLLKGRWYGIGPLGHYAISLGNGEEMAAHGVRSGIHPSDVYGGRNYQDGIILPPSMAFYKDLQPPVDAEVLAALVELQQWQQRVAVNALRVGDRGPDVVILNKLLAQRGLRPTTGDFHVYSKPVTRDAVVHFKKLAHLSNIIGDTFGDEAATAILKPAH